MAYLATNWINKVTTLGPTNLNKLEQGVANAAAVADNAMSAGSGAIPSTQKGAANGVSTLDAGSKVPIAQLPAGVANGVASLDANGHVPGAQRSYYGATPPVSPLDGDLWDFPADATAGVIWRFRYRAASASAYKWEFVGGAPVYNEIAALDSTVSTTYVALPLSLITVPRAGDYIATFTVDMFNSSAGAIVFCTLKKGAAAAADADAVSGRPQTAGGDSITTSKTTRALALAASDVLQLYAKVVSGTGSFRFRVIAVTPARVS